MGKEKTMNKKTASALRGNVAIVLSISAILVGLVLAGNIISYFWGVDVAIIATSTLIFLGTFVCIYKYVFYPVKNHRQTINTILWLIGGTIGGLLALPLTIEWAEENLEQVITLMIAILFVRIKMWQDEIDG